MPKTKINKITIRDGQCADYGGFEDASEMSRLGYPPPEYSPHEVEAWAELASYVEGNKSLQPSHSLTFRLFVDALLEYRATSRILAEDGIHYVTSSNHSSALKRKHPLFDVHRELRKQLLEFADRFGIATTLSKDENCVSTCQDDVAAKYFSD